MRDPATGRRNAPFWIVAGGLLALLCGSNLAAPLYAVYGQRFGFSKAMLALIFATYTLVLVPALLACGQLSDRFGRRPVILAGLTAGIAGLVLFAHADSVAWLFAARAVQGLSVAMISGAAVAALAELEPTATPCARRWSRPSPSAEPPPGRCSAARSLSGPPTGWWSPTSPASC